MKKTLLTASFLFSTHFIVNAQSFDPVNTKYNMEWLDTKPFQTSIQLGTVMNGIQEFSGNEPANDYERYKKRSYIKNTAAWLVFSGGALCTIIGLLTIPKHYNFIYNSKSTENQFETASKIILSGAIVMLSSIPLFVSAHSDKRKARLIISNQKAGFGIPRLNVSDIAGITMGISLSRSSKNNLQSPATFL